MTIEPIRKVEKIQYDNDFKDGKAIRPEQTEKNEYIFRVKTNLADPKDFAHDRLAEVEDVTTKSRGRLELLVSFITHGGLWGDNRFIFTMAPNGLIFSQQKIMLVKRREWGYFLSEAEEWDIALQGLGESVKNRDY